MIWWVYIVIGIVGYTYVVYPGLVFLVYSLKRIIYPARSETPLVNYPTVTILIAAYNESACIVEKIENTLSLLYPSEKKHIVVVTDGSNDGSEKIASGFSAITLLHQSERQGKSAAINRALAYVSSDIVVLTDANTLLNKDALVKLVQHFSDPKTGAVAGEKKVMEYRQDGAVAVEGFYWNYESKIRKWDAHLHSVTGAVGELFAIRRELIQTLPEGIICDDLYMSVSVIEKGYSIAYENNAYAMEGYSFSIEKEWKRKVRIAAGSIQILSQTHWLQLFIKYPVPFFQLVSRKIIRWIIVPYLIILLPIILLLTEMPENTLITVVITFIYFLYAWSFLGWLIRHVRGIPRFFYLPFYFLWSNLAIIAGTWGYLNKRPYAVWEKVR